MLRLRLPLELLSPQAEERSNNVQSICRVMDRRLVILLDPGLVTLRGGTLARIGTGPMSMPTV